VKINPIMTNPTPKETFSQIKIFLFFFQSLIIKKRIALGNKIISKGKIKIIIGVLFCLFHSLSYR